MTKSVTRLYKDIKPTRYLLQLTPDRETLTFHGHVTIELKKTGRPSQRLTFHQHGLKITAATVTKHDKKGDLSLNVVRINTQNSLDEVRIHTEETVYGGTYSVTLDFHGIISRGMTGLYPCFFTAEGKEHVMLATQFESHHAREAFPCIDEPEAKAIFELTLITEPNLSVLANTTVKEQVTQNGLLHTVFVPTPKMSSYLLAFVIGELQAKHTTTNRGTDVAIWATSAQPADSLDFALDVAKRSIEFFEDYFGVPYPLAKADHVALPDFSSGAMENWGLITYRERVLLAYPGEASQSIKEVIATVIAHETSHQWFGNLVTMRWWDDLWLNESFANLMEYQAVDAMFPEWHIWDSFIMQEGLSALRRDATPGVQAVKTNVHHPDEISTLFDPSIVYAKGGRLLYMLKNYIGESAFRQGLSAYFVKHAYGNTEGADLWAALSTASGKDVAAFMNPWLERSGFPVLSVTQTDNTVHVTQAHFLENGDTSDGRLWPVPLFANDATAPEVLTDAELSWSTATDDFVQVNQAAAGHYIVNYTEKDQRDQLIELVKDQTLSPADRLMVLNNNSMLSKAAYRSFGDVLELLRAYEHESTEAVWDMIALIAAEARRFIDYDEALEDRIKTLLRQLIKSEYQRLGWVERADDSAADKKLRATIIGLGAYAEEPAIIKESLRLFEAYKRNPDSVPAELRSIVLGVPVRHGTAGAFDYLVTLHDSTANSDLKGDITAALTITRQPAEAKQLLARLFDAQLVKPQDADRWLVYLMRNRYVRDIAWDWMVDNWNWIEATYAHDKSYDYFPRYAASVCNTTAWADKYRAFFEPKQDQIALKRNIAIGLSEIATRVAWLERDLASVQNFFRPQGYLDE